MSGWKQQQCAICAGCGMVSAYTFDGSEFEGPEECSGCGGNGYIWRSPKGALAQYPGGPFVGKETMKKANER
jgi:hypothetical protein